MAGRPKHKADMMLLDELDKQGETILALFGSSMSETAICKKLGVSRSALEKWCDKPENADRISYARARAADDLVCETLSIIDNCTLEEVQQARVRVQARQWIAERWKPNTYALRNQAVVQVNLTDLRLDALRHVQAMELSTDKVQDVEVKRQ